jgi:hypothetical protein
MKKLVSLLSVALLALPVSAESIKASHPVVKDYSISAMGCMILLDCYEGIEKISPDKDFGERFIIFKDEIKRILTGLDRLGIEIYLANEKYFTRGTIGLYKPDYNRLFISKALLDDPREFLGTVRHEGWHTVQDCMGGGIETAFMAQVHQDSEIPDWLRKMVERTYSFAGMGRAVPWEVDANWAEEQSNVTAEKLEMCAKGPLWEQIKPTPLTKEWLIGCGFMKPRDNLYPYNPNDKTKYCTPGKY